MPAPRQRTWGGSLHLTFRLLPVDRQSSNLRPFLEAEGLTPEELLARLPYDRARSGATAAQLPDPKRYRDGKQVYQTAGLLYEHDGRIRVTALGNAVLRWLTIINDHNRVILGRHAAYALTACQLRNPTGAGEKYEPDVDVFPFAFIWRAMLALDGRISSDELNRGLFKVTNEESLHTTIAAIRHARAAADVTTLGDEVVSGPAKNDRLIPWMALASFGWTLFRDKRGGDDSDYYELLPDRPNIVEEAARVRHRHREFTSVQDYVEHIASCASLPKDLR